jgi:hypothetical protein
MMFRSILYSLLVLAAVTRLGADTTQRSGDWDSVTVATVKTSIYVGSVTLTTGEFVRQGDNYTTTYEAKVWPWFFWSEHGSITITLPEAELLKLTKGQRAEFSGEARNQKNKPRHVTGYAEQTNPANGKIKVRIGVDDTELVFNSTYRFNNVVK